MSSELSGPGAAAGPDDGQRASSLTQWLRARSDDELATLLRRRPDLSLPAPADLGTLASRMSVRTSVQRAVDGLDAATLQVLEALVLAAGRDERADATQTLLGDTEQVHHALVGLRELGLVWGDDDEVRLVNSVRESVGTYPAGLGRPAALLLAAVPDVQIAQVQRALGLPAATQPRAGAAVAAVLGDADRVRGLVSAADDDERAVLDRLAQGPPVGVLRGPHAPTPATPTPADRLATRGLLVTVDARTVELPREIALVVRDEPLGPSEAHPPEIAITRRDPAELDGVGTTAVLETLRLTETLAESWTATPPAQLRAGGLGVRDLRRTARELDVTEDSAAVLVEVAYAAGLIGPTQGHDPAFLPTSAYDDWLAATPAARWTALAAAWLGMTRQPSLVNQRDDRDRVISALGPDVERGTVAALRARVLDLLTTLPPGATPTGADTVLDRLDWQAPRRSRGVQPVAEAVLREADLLGVTAAGGLTGYSRTLRDGSRTVAEQVLAGALPTPVDHFLVQPDLTVVVPGQPTPDVARRLALVADLESSGGAQVYRITESTVRRALDEGLGAEGISTLLQRSRTPIPQALSYLVDDAARRHGVLRAGPAAGYLRCDDEALLTRVVADDGLAALQLRQIAPTVAISSAGPRQLLDALRAAGYAPAAESPGGELVQLEVEAPRAPSRTPTAPARVRPRDNDAQLAELVRRVRAGDALTGVTHRVAPVAAHVPGVTSAKTMELLRTAIQRNGRVLLGYVDDSGTASRHVLRPISMAGGAVRGYGDQGDRLQSFALHRITAVSMLSDPDGEADEPA